MAEKFVPDCLPFFRDETLDNEQRTEKVVALLKDRSALRGELLDSFALDVLKLCWDRIKAEDKAKRDVKTPQAFEVALPQSPSPSRRLDPTAMSFTPLSTYSAPNEAQHAAYENRRNAFHAGIIFMDQHWEAACQERIRQAEGEIATLQAEHDALVTRFFDNYKGIDSLHRGADVRSVWSCRIRQLQMDCLKLWIEEIARPGLRFLAETRDMYFEDLFPREGEMGPAE
ncbi:MAG: hypothetical protein Q9182_006759 [Xanthomendoza sp. 2 TL-2023]